MKAKELIEELKKLPPEIDMCIEIRKDKYAWQGGEFYTLRGVQKHLVCASLLASKDDEYKSPLEED